MRSSGSVARPCRRNKNGRGASLLRSAALSHSATLSGGGGGLSPPSTLGESYDVKGPGRARRCGFSFSGPTRSSGGGGGESPPVAGDACHHLTPLLGSGGHATGADGGGGRILPAAGCASSRGHRMFQMQKAMNRAERTGGAGGYSAVAAKSATAVKKVPSPSQQQQQGREQSPLLLPPQFASRVSYVACAPSSSDGRVSASAVGRNVSPPGPFSGTGHAGLRGDLPGSLPAAAAAATGSLTVSDATGGVEGKGERRQAWGTTCSPSSVRGRLAHHRDGSGDIAGQHVTSARNGAGSPRCSGASGASMPACLGEGPSPQGNAGRLRYREYAAGIMPAVASSPGKGKGRNVSGEESQSHRAVSSTSGASGGDGAGASAARERGRVSATTDLRVEPRAEKESVAVSRLEKDVAGAPSTSSPLVAPPNVLLPPSGLTARSQRCAPESKSTWTSPTCLARWEETILPGCTPPSR